MMMRGIGRGAEAAAPARVVRFGAEPGWRVMVVTIEVV
jgi:hypothetical protein